MLMVLVLSISSHFKKKHVRHLFILYCFIILCSNAIAQVKVNRYSESKVSPNGIAGKTSMIEEIVIPAIDVNAVINKWNNERTPKFAEPTIVSISPLEQGLWEQSGDTIVNRLKITAQGAHSIAVYFDKLKLSKNAELFIYNSEGTVVTGPITEKENLTTKKLWASNVFTGNSIIIEFKAPANEQKLNSLHVQKILYGIPPKILPAQRDSLMGPGFGLSSSCNVNVICISGWEMERRAVAQVVDEGGGWCSASLVMNACGTIKPYILTANHCIEQNGNVINTNNSTFEFLWFSPKAEHLLRD